jgi:hypothetical protein
VNEPADIVKFPPTPIVALVAVKAPPVCVNVPVVEAVHAAPLVSSHVPPAIEKFDVVMDTVFVIVPL